MRIGQGWLSFIGQYDYDNTSFGWHVWSTADAHHEDTVRCGLNFFAHAVDDNVREPNGGFNRGRDDVYKNWTGYGTGPHTWRGWQNWSNTMHFTQCNGNVAWSDGYVDFIEVVSYSGH